jgi:hypothetical protein
MDKENVVHTHNGILFSHEKNKILSHSKMGIQLQIIILNEIRQAWKDKSYMSSLMANLNDIFTVLRRKYS